MPGQLSAALARSYLETNLLQSNQLLNVRKGDGYVGVLLTVEQFELMHHVVSEAWAKASALNSRYHDGFENPAAL